MWRSIPLGWLPAPGISKVAGDIDTELLTGPSDDAYAKAQQLRRAARDLGKVCNDLNSLLRSYVGSTKDQKWKNVVDHLRQGNEILWEQIGKAPVWDGWPMNTVANALSHLEKAVALIRGQHSSSDVFVDESQIDIPDSVPPEERGPFRRRLASLLQSLTAKASHLLDRAAALEYSSPDYSRQYVFMPPTTQRPRRRSGVTEPGPGRWFPSGGIKAKEDDLAGRLRGAIGVPAEGSGSPDLAQRLREMVGLPADRDATEGDLRTILDL